MAGMLEVGLIMLAVSCVGARVLAADQDVRTIGSRLELLVDDWLIERMEQVELRLHHPAPQEVALVFDQPWEGNTSAYVTVFRDGDRCRMYYRGSDYDFQTKTEPHPEWTCYAESADGIHWTRPELGLYEFQGSTRNNIVWSGPGSHNFTPFKDANPNCPPEARYKALGIIEGGLVAFQSPDGIHWSLMQEQPIITEGAFDSQNLAFWDSERGCYAEFHRGFRDGVRDIMTCTSEDFLHWTKPEWLNFGDAPPEHLYTNAVQPYFRAPHLYLGFPKRFLPDRSKMEHLYPGISDGVFMTSRDGLHWHRWREAFVRPGPQPDRWINRNNMTAWGMLVTPSALPGAPEELSLYTSEAYYIDGNRLRRMTLRMDGFVSAHAGGPQGELVTRPLVFEGRTLVINYATSAAGSLRVEIQDRAGNPLPGFELARCPEIYGDEIERGVAWEGSSDVSALAGQVVRLRFVMQDADLYSLRFRP